GEHGMADKWFMHEESIRVPLIVSDPRANARGTVLPQLALNIDIAPTLLDLAGVRAPASVQGRSLLPLLRGESSGWRREFFYEHRFRYNGWIPSTEGIRNERWKYTRYIDEQPVPEDLFDLAADPLEERNLVSLPDSRAQLDRLRQRHAVWSRALAEWRPDSSWKDPN
ncbi:MAG: DUF4976 domain-containing protein, partial [Bryobacter sp.]|nr:DUF4976 domain-containing protein [Bryobacter sp.]